MFLSSLYTCIWRICTKYVWTNLHICLIFVYICMYCLLPLYMCIHVKQYLYIFGEIAYCLCICVYMWSIYLYILPIRVYMWSMYLYVLPIAFVYVYTCEAFVHMYKCELVRTCQKTPCGERGYFFFFGTCMYLHIHVYVCSRNWWFFVHGDCGVETHRPIFFFWKKNMIRECMCIRSRERQFFVYAYAKRD